VNGLLGRPYTWMRNNVGQLLFERRYGVRTSGKILLDEFGLAEQDRVYYIPANWRTLRRSLRRNEVTDSDVFIDLGCGMGRMVIEAARYPFQRVIGVELAPELHEIAGQNVKTTKLPLLCKDIELVRSDVLDYDIPDDVTVVFMNNPFRGEIFASVVRKLIASADARPRPIRLIYGNPVEEPMLLDTGRFRHLRTVTQPRAKPGSLFGVVHIYLLIPAADVA
jgi:SAM-dependent methyltransferase